MIRARRRRPRDPHSDVRPMRAIVDRSERYNARPVPPAAWSEPMADDPAKMPVAAPGAQAPRGALVRLARAAAMLGCSEAEVLDLGEERGGGEPLIRMCIMVPEAAVIYPFKEPLPAPPGAIPADLRYGYINASNTPGFFRELADKGRASLDFECLALVNGRGAFWAFGLEVVRDTIMVVREDVEAYIRVTPAGTIKLDERIKLPWHRDAVDRARKLIGEDRAGYMPNGKADAQLLARMMVASTDRRKKLADDGRAPL